MERVSHAGPWERLSLTGPWERLSHTGPWETLSHGCLSELYTFYNPAAWVRSTHPSLLSLQAAILHEEI